MRTLAALLLLGLPGASHALFGIGEAPPLVLLWLPPENFSAWEELDAAFSRSPWLKLTVGVVPEALSPVGEEVLARWAAKGRLEPALRLKGDPILPLILSHPTAPRPEDALNRLALSKERFRLLFDSPPAGFVPGAGALSPSLLVSAGPLGLAWAAGGEYASSTSAWAAAGGITVVPFRGLAAAGPETGPEGLVGTGAGPSLVALDEAGGMVPAGSILRLLKALPEARCLTVSEALAGKTEARLDAKALRAWPAWQGLGAWTSHPASQKAWKLYGEAAESLELYQNSGSADLKPLEDATEALYEAQAGRYYRLLGAHGEVSEPLDKEFRRHLMAVYRKIKQTPPHNLYSPLLEGAPSSGSYGSGGASEPVSTDVRFLEGPSWLAFENPSGSQPRAPAGSQPFPDGSRPEQLWRIVSLRVEWDESQLTFLYRMARLDNSAGAPFDLGALVLETYIDLNGVVGAGSIQLLEGRGAFVQAKDAWEYALVATGWGAFLYRSSPLGDPRLVGPLTLQADAKAAEVRLTVPRASLRGNPLRWGYVTVAMAADPATAAEKPPKPLAAAGEACPLLGLLAPVELQEALKRDAATRHLRLAALRAR